MVITMTSKKPFFIHTVYLDGRECVSVPAARNPGKVCPDGAIGAYALNESAEDIIVAYAYD